MKYYFQEKQAVMKALQSSESGLRASEVEKRLGTYGKNKLAEEKKTSLFARFLKQLADPMILVLLAAAILSGITSAYAGESFADVFIILFVVVLNSVLGVVEENKAEKAIDALKTMTAATSKVLRDGKVIVVKSEELVPGDIIRLEAGDSVPADARIIECASMKVEESALTGESVPVEKRRIRLTQMGRKFHWATAEIWFTWAVLLSMDAASQLSAALACRRKWVKSRMH